jgi:hypothetical protein
MYTVRLEKWEDSEGQFGPNVRGTFLIMKGLEKDKKLVCSFPIEHTSKNKLGRFIKAVFGDYDNSLEYNPEEMMGQIVRVTVKNETTKDGTFSRIQEFYNEKAE